MLAEKVVVEKVDDSGARDYKQKQCPVPGGDAVYDSVGAFFRRLADGPGSWPGRSSSWRLSVEQRAGSNWRVATGCALFLVKTMCSLTLRRRRRRRAAMPSCAPGAADESAPLNTEMARAAGSNGGVCVRKNRCRRKGDVEGQPLKQYPGAFVYVAAHINEQKRDTSRKRDAF